MQLNSHTDHVRDVAVQKSYLYSVQLYSRTDHVCEVLYRNHTFIMSVMLLYRNHTVILYSYILVQIMSVRYCTESFLYSVQLFSRTDHVCEALYRNHTFILYSYIPVQIMSVILLYGYHTFILYSYILVQIMSVRYCTESYLYSVQLYSRTDHVCEALYRNHTFIMSVMLLYRNHTVILYSYILVQIMSVRYCTESYLYSVQLYSRTDHVCEALYRNHTFILYSYIPVQIMSVILLYGYHTFILYSYILVQIMSVRYCTESYLYSVQLYSRTDHVCEALYRNHTFILYSYIPVQIMSVILLYGYHTFILYSYIPVQIMSVRYCTEIKPLFCTVIFLNRSCL